MLRYECLELANQLGVLSAGEVSVDAVFQQCQPQLLEPADLRLRERLESEIGERRPAPEREGLPQLLRGLPGVVGGQRLAALVGQALAPVEVELAGLHVDQVAIRPSHDPSAAVAESLAQPRHLDLDALSRRGGRVLAPQLLDELIGRYGFVGMNQEDREQRTLPAAGDRDRPAGLVDFEWAEHPELHGTTLPALNRGATSVPQGRSRPQFRRRKPCKPSHTGHRDSRLGRIKGPRCGSSGSWWWPRSPHWPWR